VYTTAVQLVPQRKTSARGQTLVEYGLLIALIAVVAIAALLFLGPVVSGLFRDIGNTIQGT
jgi:pilus assembly protein Flp/PilA